MDKQIQKRAQVFMQLMAQNGKQIEPKQALQQIMQITQAAESGDQEAAAMLQQIDQFAQQMTQAARHGAKLSYMQSLTNTCPEGYEMGYFKRGGTMCKKCMKKAEQGQKMTQDNKPKSPVEEFKCGRRIKKGEVGAELEVAGNPKKKQPVKAKPQPKQQPKPKPKPKSNNTGSPGYPSNSSKANQQWGKNMGNNYEQAVKRGWIKPGEFLD